jgi:hypothetical protein
VIKKKIHSYCFSILKLGNNKMKDSGLPKLDFPDWERERAGDGVNEREKEMGERIGEDIFQSSSNFI